MSENYELRKYFIKDKGLTKIDDDKLSSKDITTNLEMIIDNTEPPYAIALTGKSGMGKTSIINMLVEKYNEDTQDHNNYSIQKINVWKDEQDLKSILSSNNSISTELATENTVIVNDEINANINNKSNTRYSDNISPTSGKLNILSQVAKVFLTFIVCFLITTIIFIFMEYLGNKQIYNQNDIFFVENTYLSYRDNIGMIFVFAFGLTVIAYIIDTIRLAAKKSREKTTSSTIQSSVNGNLDINTTIIDNRSESNIITSNKKDIIIIEDIDKLPVNKMLKTLEDIRYCSSYNNCILIVPFDDTVVAKAIDIRNKIKLSANYRPLKFNRLLDKLFQFKVCVPYISSGDIKDYAVNLVQETVPDFIAEYCPMNTFERIIREILIYKNITTPREVKKVINNFINNKILIVNRAKNGKIDESIINDKNFDMQLAKISVIQSEFEEFYDILFKDFDYLEALTGLYCLEQSELRNVFENVNEDLKPFFAPKYKSLMTFLRKTRNCKVNNMSTIMYYTKVKSEKMYKDKSVLGYILGDEDISELRIQEVLELVKLLDSKEDLREFTDNNFDKLLEKYKDKSSNKIFFVNINEIVNIVYEYIEELSYIKYLEIVADNYNYYPQEAFEMFKNVEIQIPAHIMNILIKRIKENLSKENYDEVFEFLKDNSEAFYEENGNISEYVNFLVNYIGLSSQPDSVITELDENFTRIGKIYELNKNIKGLENIDYDKAYAFIAKCIDNGDLDRMINVMNLILSDENSVEDCLNIEERMNNYSLVDLIECNVDDLAESDENAKLLENNYILLRNLIELATVKQESLAPVDAMKIIEKALANTGDSAYILDVYEVLKKFDRMYFYEIRREFNEIIYLNFHNTENMEVKKVALDCTRYFRNTRLFLTKLNEDEKKFYEQN